MKKLFVVFALFIFCFSVVCAESFMPETLDTPHPDEALSLSASACEHVFRIVAGTDPIRAVWFSVNSQYYEYRKFYTASCINEGCTADGKVCVAEQIGQHNWVYTGTNYHNKGKNTHSYVHTCPVCGTVTNFDFPCGGTGNGDCPVMVFPTARSANAK